MFVATKLEGGGEGKALVAGPLKKDRFFAASRSPFLLLVGSRAIAPEVGS